jgi:hypothetical protein
VFWPKATSESTAWSMLASSGRTGVWKITRVPMRRRRSTSPLFASSSRQRRAVMRDTP